MESKNRQVLEALQMQPLSEEEKASRHILGRLYGPIATCKEKTRNGRGYNKELWEKALADDIFKEKLATKSLFLELGHPADREETDMTKVCACIPEMPKIVDGDLYAYVDILDTNNGRLLKTLCDYGFVPGISSRGSGDIMANDEVDPETFFLETWDIVQLPAVKKARLSMCESFNGKKPLKAVLCESLENASEKDQKVMKEALENLNINIEEEPIEECNKQPIKEAEETYPNGTPVDISQIPEAPELEECTKAPLTEEGEEEELAKVEQEEAPEEQPAEETPAEEVEEAPTAATVEEFVKQFDDYDKDLAVEFKPIVIEDKEYEVTHLELDDSEEGKVIVSIGYNPVEGDNKEDIEVDSGEELAKIEAEGTPEEAADGGDDEVIESLKEAVRQKDLLENEIRDLKNQKTVSDAEVNDLKEELEKYKSGFIRVSELASKSGKLEKEVNLLKEQLSQKDTTIKDLQTKVENHTSLTESIDAKDAKITSLTEQLAAAQTEADETEKALTEQVNSYKKKLLERTNLAKTYKGKYDAVIERYIASKANMLGVRPQDITSRLNEGYTLDDIDKVCDDLLNEGRPMFGLGYGSAKVKINESKGNPVKKAPIDPDNGYEIDDDLLILAGLK